MESHTSDYLETKTDGDDLQDDVEEDEEEDWKAPVMMGQDEEARHPRGISDSMDNHDHQRTIVHIDLDCFYAQVEMIRDPSLRNKPLGIQQKNIVVTTNYVARERNVGKLSYIKDALEKCPDLVLVSGEDLTHYREMSYKVTEVLQKFDPTVERLGFDENYIDVSSLVEKSLKNNNTQDRKGEKRVAGHLYNEEPLPECICGCHQRLAIGSQIAKEMREALHKELELTSCAGVAHNKLLAKLVGGHRKPNNQTMIYPEHAQQMMISLGKARAIPGIGHSTAKRLASMGISTIQDLLDAPKTVLESEFGQQQASTMQQLAQGIDNSQVTATGAPQSISDEDSFKKCSTLSNAKERMLGLLQNLLKRLKSDGRIPQTIRVTVRKYSPKQWKRESRQCSLPPGILKSLNKDESTTLSKLLDISVGLFHKMVDSSKPFHLTLINICFAKIQTATKSSANIDNYFSPKKSAVLQKTLQSETSGSVCDSTVIAGDHLADARTSSNNSSLKDKGIGGKRDDLKQHQTSPAKKSHSGTLESFFSSPKRKRVRLSQTHEFQTLSTQSNFLFQKDTSLDGFASTENSISSSLQDERTCHMQIISSSAMNSQVFQDMSSQSTHTDGREHPHSQSGTLCYNNDIPPNVDPDVFRELPTDVQEELRAQHLSNLQAHVVDPVNDRMQACSSAESRDERSIDISDASNEGAEDVIETSGQFETHNDIASSDNVLSASQSGTVSLTGRTLSSTDAVRDPASSSNSKLPGSAAAAPDDVTIPPGVDPDVFAGLPSEMKQELINEWKQGTYEISSVDLRHGGSKHSHGQTKGKSKGKSISDYFKK